MSRRYGGCFLPRTNPCHFPGLDDPLRIPSPFDPFERPRPYDPFERPRPWTDCYY